MIYTKGFIAAEEGSNIANWITSNDGFYHLNGNSQKDIWLSPNGITGIVNDNEDSYALYANGNFGVTTNGNLYANNADISGTINSDNGKIGGFNISDYKLWSENTNHKITGMASSNYPGDPAFYAGGADP